MDIGYSICKCYFSLVTFYFIAFYYKTGGMLGVGPRKYLGVNRLLAASLGGSRVGIRHILQMTACWSPCFLWSAQNF